MEYKECNLWDEIKNCCENQNIEIKGFIYKNMKFIVIKKNTQIGFVISQINDKEIIKILNDLPYNITKLIIFLDGDIDGDPRYTLLGGFGGGFMQLIAYGCDTYLDWNDFDYLNNVLTNLPISLRSITFITKELKDVKNEIMYNSKKFERLFNFLFSIKLPFDSKIYLRYGKKIYNVDAKNNSLIISNCNFNFTITNIKNKQNFLS